ncbi:MAG: transglycosylase [Rhodomicrobium sp.]
MTTALQILLVVTLIGIIAGLAISRYGRGWFGTRASNLTAALVGIAGAFLGFHVGVAAGLTPVPVADYLVAIAGALLTLWAWRNR